MNSVPLGPFNLVEQIGEGGMAKVWRGVHRAQGVPVAVKVLEGARARNPDYVRAFRREVQAMARLVHPGITTVFDYGQLDPETCRLSADAFVPGSPYLVMECAAGTLHTDFNVGEWSTLRRLLLALLDALAHAHARGVIHRDIKPENVLLMDGDDRSIRFKLTDFGIAHALDAGATADTTERLSSLAGTPLFMPPEQLEGNWREFGPWTDLYALGCMAYELTCGRVPFPGNSLSEIAAQHIEGARPEMLPQFGVPDGYEDWIQRLMAREPSRRFRRAADASWALAQLPAEIDTDETLSEEPIASEQDSATAPTMELSETRLSDPSTLPTLVSSPPVASSPSQPSDRAPEETPHDDLPSEPLPALESPPPLPDTWRNGSPHLAGDQLVGVGLGLFGLREVPFVDRTDGRDVIWTELEQVWDSRHPRAVVVRGDSGTGKSRLVEWMSQRAHQVGGATVLRAPHSPHGGPMTGLSHMLATYFQAWHLSGNELAARISHCLSDLPGASVGKKTSEHDYEVRALTELIRPSSEGAGDVEQSTHFDFSSARERYATVASLLRRISARRPVLLWLDDIQWGADALRLANYILAEREGATDSPFPILLVLTVRNEALGERPGISERVESLSKLSTTRVLRVDPLPAEYHVELIQRLLPLDDELVREVQRRTEGNPLFAVQLVGDWVERGTLVPGDQGFEIREGAAMDIPDTIHELWIRRVERVLIGFSSDVTSELRIALEIAAALGHRVTEREWRAVCGAALGQLAMLDELVEGMVKQGLADRDEQGWAFVHSLLRESLARTSREAGRWPDLHGHCADTLAVLSDERHRLTARRRVEHLIEARQDRAALEPLFVAIRQARKLGDLQDARRLLEVHDVLVDDLDLPDESSHRIRNWWLHAVFARQEGEVEKARTLTERALRAARQHDRPYEHGLALWLKGSMLDDQARSGDALDFFDRAHRLFQISDHSIDTANNHLSRGIAANHVGDFDSARRFYRRAGEIYASHERQAMCADTWNQIAYTWMANGRYDRACQTSRRALELARQAGNRRVEAHCWNTLGEVARYREQWDEARRYYSRVHDLLDTCGLRGAHISRFNIALVEVATGNYSAAGDIFGDLKAAYPEVGLRIRLPLVYAGAACSAAGTGEWAVFEADIQRAEKLVGETGIAHKDAAWLADEAGSLAGAAGFPNRARHAYQLALDQWSRVDDEASAERVRRLLGEL